VDLLADYALIAVLAVMVCAWISRRWSDRLDRWARRK
jgi:hypothetical protein